MKKTFLKFLAGVTAVTTIAFAFAGCGGGSAIEVPSFGDEYINIGLSGPLTEGAAIYGIAAQNSAKLAVKEINDNGGLSNGIKFAFEMLDDKAKGDISTTTYASLKDKGMQITLGTVTTGAFLGIKQDLIKDEIFTITPSATGDDVTKGATNIYQMCFSDSNQGTVAAEFVNENVEAGKKIGILYRSSDPYSKGIYDKFKASIDTTKFPDITEAPFTDENPTDLSGQVALLKNCEFIFMPIYYTPASVFMSQANTTISATAVYFGCDGLDGIDNIEGFDIKGIRQEVSMLSHFNSKATEGEAKTFCDKFLQYYDASELNQFGASTYDCIYAIKDILNTAIANGKTVTASLTAKEFTAIIKEVLDAGYEYKNGVTGSGASITWKSGADNGQAVKHAVKYIVKAKNA